jgi:TRAP-type uncharacterized transport system substrate-binding protein
MIYTVGHPSGSIQEATTACDSVLVTVWGDTIVDKLVADNSYYRTATIPAACIAATTKTCRPSVWAQPS